MTRTETGILAALATCGVLIALAIPEPATMPQKPPGSAATAREWSGMGQRTFAPPRSPAGEFGAAAVAVDGDTIRLGGVVVRLAGIDAPESAQACRDPDGRSWACGAASTASLRGMIERDPAVTCLARTQRDRYGRTLATCSNSLGDLGALQVARGLAVAYRRYSSAYVDQEDAAKAEKLGMWAGEFTMPEQWRRESGR